MTLEIKNGSMHTGDDLLFSKLNVRVSSGQTVCIQGARGSGKTRLLRAIMGLERLSDGFINIDGELLTVHSAATFRRLMGYVPQAERLPFANMNTMLAELWTLRNNHANLPDAPDAQRRAALMQQLGLPEALATKPLAELTAGQNYRIMLAAAAMLNKQILLIDEPAAPLDSAAAQMVDGFLHGLASAGAAVVAVSQDELFAQSCSQTIRLTN